MLGNRLNETRNNFSFPTHLRFPVLADDIEEYGLKDSYQRGYGESSLVISSSDIKIIRKPNVVSKTRVSAGKSPFPGYGVLPRWKSG